ncbi:uncharacterized protein LOC122667249 [Telopea speciosissima]|uniref:uncharacterized protein LOC122667249 n=1 Tax=Telopea speciosissima TaxID=54955 RepID=UPI001CC523C9|nr:uncharacterized protein LOC122667249 [Telopea speciosissima]
MCPSLGTPLFVLVSKLCEVKRRLKDWSHSSLCNLDQRVTNYTSSLDSLQTQLRLSPDNEDLMHQEKSSLDYCDRRPLLGKEKLARSPILDGYKKGQWLHTEDEIRDAAANFFHLSFGGSSPVTCPLFALPVNRSLSHEDGLWLGRPFTNAEIKQVVFSYAADSAPGTDGFNSKFFTSTWDITGVDVCAAIQDFFLHGHLLSELKLSKLVLIPKGDSPTSFSDYRPIAVSSILYRFITKVIANRLKGVIHHLIGKNQTAFMSSRYITDNILLCQELLHDYHSPSDMPRFAAKLDIRKAFDSVYWSFLFTLLLWLNFPSNFIGWIVECVTNPSFVVVINGGQSRVFSGNRGLRQGCPLSPALFSIVLQFFSDSLGLLAECGQFEYHSLCAKPAITSLCFADDLFVFGKALVVSTALDIPLGSLPITYLGVPISSKKLRPNDFGVLTTRVEHRLSSWKGRFLSFAGRLQLIRLVLYGTISYWLNVFRLPSQTIRQLERLMARFLWLGHSDRGSHKVAWHTLTRVGLTLSHPAGYDGTPSGLSLLPRSVLPPRKVPALRCSTVFLHDGTRTSLWYDPWLPRGSLSSPGVLIAPALGRHPFATVSTLFSSVDSTMPDPVIAARWSEIGASRFFARLPSDTTVWTASSSGRFSIKSDWHASRVSQPVVNWHHLIWASTAHPRFSFVAWLAAREALSLRTKVADWGLSPERNCYFCNLNDETFDHLFFGCSYTRAICKEVLLLYGYRRDPLPTWQSELGWACSHFTGSSFVAHIKQFSFSAVIYRIWSERNSRAFQHAAHRYSVIVHLIIADTRDKFSNSAGVMPETPCARWFAISCDGSVRSQGAGYGSIGRNHLGTPLFAIAGGTTNRNVLRMELLAIRILNGHMTPPWTTFDLVHDVWDLRDSFSGLQFQFHVRETNFCADFLAGFLHFSEEIHFCIDNLPPRLLNLVHKDASGHQYFRL